MNQNDNLNIISIKSQTSPSSPKNVQHKLIIRNKDLNKINDEILDHQKFYEYIAKFKNENINLGKEILQMKMNILNKSFLREKNNHSYDKLKKDIQHICRFVYNNKNSIDNNKNKNRYINDNNIKINLLQSVKPFNYSINKGNTSLNSSTENYQMKSFLNDEKNNMISNYCQTVQKEKLRNNTIDYIEKKNKKIQMNNNYEDYIYSNNSVKHPQIYVLKNNRNRKDNNNINSMEKLPIIKNRYGIKIRRADLSYLIPEKREKSKEIDNYYNYYFGKNLIRNKFDY